MKLQKILGGALVAGVLALSATAVYAADSISFGKPIDLETNAEVTDYTEGMIIAIPVDIVSNTGYIDSFSIKATGAEGFAPGATNAELGATRLANLRSRANKLVASNGSLYAASNIKLDDGFDISYPGTYDVAVSGSKISTGWMNSPHIAVNADAPELYLVYKVTSVPTGLNADVATVVDGECSFSDTASGQGMTDPTPANEAKANACAGAFTITLDDKELAAAHKFVQGLYVEIYGNKTNIYDYTRTGDETNGYTYTFPVRLKGTAGGDIAVDIYAEISETETGAASPVKISADDFTVTLNSPADYTAADVTVK